MDVMPVAKSNNITNNNISISLWLNAILSPFCLWLFKIGCKGKNYCGGEEAKGVEML